LLSIINEILDFSKYENNEIELDYIAMNPELEFKNIFALLQETARKKNISYKCEIDNNIFKYIVCDPTKIKQVILNLLSNAIKFTADNGEVILKIDADTIENKQSLRISISDTGIGIEKNKLKDIFKAFQQADITTTREYGGTGLGLTISKSIVERLGGKLKVISVLGKGSEFYFSIIVEKGTKPVDTIEYKKEVVFENKKLLLVEDNKTNQLYMKVILNKLKIDFDIANDGQEAIEYFEKNIQSSDDKYDAILMDENMPIMNGIEATKNILAIEKQERLQHIPIIALTANALKGDREKFLASGMDEYIAKPVNKQQLVTMLNELLNKG